MEKNKGLLIVISGPSGSGKGTVVKALREIAPEIGLSISATTRNPREGEEHAREYYFITREEFERMLGADEILEYTTYCENYYGTPKAEVERVTGEGRDLILEIEVDGAAQIKKKYPDSITIMLIPPDIKVLEERLRSRGTEEDSVVRARVDRAREEITLAAGYDYIVVNEDGAVEDCAKKILAIMSAEKFRYSRMANTVDNFTSI